MLIRINPEVPTMSAVAQLRFWQEMNDEQIEQVLGQSPNQIEKMENPHLMNTTTTTPAALSDTEYVVREFLDTDPAAAPTFIQGVVSTEADGDTLQIESLLTLSDGQHSATFDFSVFDNITTPEARAERLQDIKDRAEFLSNFRKQINDFLDVTMDALLEGVTVVRSYGDDA